MTENPCKDLDFGPLYIEEVLPEWVQTGRRIRARVEAMRDVMVGGNHLTSILIRDLGGRFGSAYPPTMPPLEALEKIGAGDTFDVWCCWAAIMRARAALAQPAGDQ